MEPILIFRRRDSKQTGWQAYLMEIDLLYCDVIVQRWEQFTGRKAERVSK
jgi:DNA modification methylase